MLSIIIVNYKSESRTIEYISTELKKITSNFITVVVNNAATDESNNRLVNALNAELVKNIENIIDKKKRFYVIPHTENLGYARGNNLGTDFSKKHFKVDYFLFSNNDIRFVNIDVVERLVDKLSNLPNVAIIGPKVIGLDGKYQSPEPYYPFWLRYMARYWLQPFLPPKTKQSFLKFGYSERAKEGEHYKVMGSFFVARAKDYFKCEGMDPNTFLFSEEVILTERMKNIGKSVYYYPQVSILHEHGATISKSATNSVIQKLEFESESYYYLTYKKVPCIIILLGKLSLNLYIYIRGKIR